MDSTAMSVMPSGIFLLIVLVSWAIPLAFAIWLFLSVQEMKSLLRDIRDGLRPARGEAP